MPRTRSITRRAFIGVTRTYRACARATRSVSSTTPLRSATASPPVVLHVPAERARGGELAQLVADHGLGDEHRHVLAAVVHRDRVAEHRGDDHGPTGPRLDDVLGALLVLAVHLL